MTVAALWMQGAEPTRIEKTYQELGEVGEEVTCVVAHPRNDVLLIGTVTGRIVAWDPTQGASLGAFEAHRMSVTSIVFSPNAEVFVTAGQDHWLRSWNSQFELLREFEMDDEVYAASVSPDNSLLAAGGKDQKLRLFELATGRHRITEPDQSNPITCCTWISEGFVACGDAGGMLWVWEAEARRCVRRGKVHEQHVSQVLSAHTGHWYLTSGWDGVVKVWNPQHREKFSFPKTDQAIMNLSLTDDDKLLVASSWEGNIRVSNLDTGAVVDEYPTGEEAVAGCVLLPGSKTIVTSSQQGRLRAWSLEEMGMIRFVNKHSSEVYSVNYTPDNEHVLSAGYDAHLKVWGRNERSEIGYIEIHNEPVLSCAISPDSAFWAVGTKDGLVKFWDVNNQTFDTTISAHKDGVTCLQFLPTGDKLVTGSWDMKLKLWSLENQYCETVFDGHSKEISSCDISLDGRYVVSGSWDSTARIWDLLEKRGDFGIQILCLEGHSERVLSCAFSPDGRIVATGSADRNVLLWPATEHGEPRLLSGHSGPVTAVKFTPDGQLLVTADRHGNVMIWDAIHGSPLGALQHEFPILTLAIAPDGTQAVVGDESGRVAFIDLNYKTGPNWIVASVFFKPASIWKRGAPPTEHYEAMCVYCGNNEEIPKKLLGDVWKCGKCGSYLRICPRTLPTHAK